MARTPAPGARQRILETADRLFYEKGLHAVGLQEIVDVCGCGRTCCTGSSRARTIWSARTSRLVSFYEQWRRLLVEEATAPLADDPAGQIVAIVELVAEQVGSWATAAARSSRRTPRLTTLVIRDDGFLGLTSAS